MQRVGDREMCGEKRLAKEKGGSSISVIGKHGKRNGASVVAQRREIVIWLSLMRR